MPYKQGIKEENMKPWKLHWDVQLYKALEHQYQLGLEILNENLPEIKVELLFRYLTTFFVVFEQDFSDILPLFYLVIF